MSEVIDNSPIDWMGWKVSTKAVILGRDNETGLEVISGWIGEAWNKELNRFAITPPMPSIEKAEEEIVKVLTNRFKVRDEQE